MYTSYRMAWNTLLPNNCPTCFDALRDHSSWTLIERQIYLMVYLNFACSYLQDHLVPVFQVDLCFLDIQDFLLDPPGLECYMYLQQADNTHTCLLTIGTKATHLRCNAIAAMPVWILGVSLCQLSVKSDLMCGSVSLRLRKHNSKRNCT